MGPSFDFNGNSFSAGPNSTPTVDGNLVYGLGSQGILVCADANSGKIVWKKNLPQELKGEVNPIGGGPDKMGWGYSWSPLIDGEKLICVPGGPQGLLAALNKKTGEVLWRSAEITYQAPYASPLQATFHGQKTVVQITQTGCVGANPENGKKLWEFKRESPYPDVVCTTPVISGNLVFTSAGFGAGSDCLKINKSGSQFTADAVYSKKDIANDNGGIVLVGKHVYGFHLRRAWECLELETGKVAWTAPRRALGAGSVCVADGRLYLLTEDAGEIAMLAASPEGYKEISKFTLPELSKIRKSRGRIWTHPVISNGHLYIRDQELLFCFDIR
ncbi:MAG: polyvinylalcohol dehydrogenase [Gemmataceae bacterium]|nr:polyvinylalcohol dehydrogenase [Gemmataceae bacterium]